MKRGIIAVILLLFSCPASYATTVTADDCTLAKVSAAVISAGRGGIVNIPICESTDWDGTLTITTGITIVGSGGFSTIINNAIADLANWGYTIIYAPDATAINNNETFDISGIQFKTNGGEYQACLQISVDSSSLKVTNVRVHHNHFNGGPDNPGWMYKAVEFVGESVGLVDNNLFTNTRKAINSYGTNYDTWEAFYPASIGSFQNVYFENNTLINTINAGTDCCSGVVSSGNGGRIVTRFNIWNGIFGYSILDAHGNQTSEVVGSLLHEAYYNTINYAESNKFMDLRGGVGLIFYNTGTPTGPYSQSFTIRDEITDLELPDVTGTEHVHASYIFKNLNDGDEVVPTNDIDVDNVIDENDEYWLFKSDFNGSIGIGVGTAMQKNAISTCTGGVGFWVTDEGNWRAGYPGISGQLYICGESNNWILYYTPYTYPHPLRWGDPVAGINIGSGTSTFTPGTGSHTFTPQ